MAVDFVPLESECVSGIPAIEDFQPLPAEPFEVAPVKRDWKAELEAKAAEMARKGKLPECTQAQLLDFLDSGLDVLPVAAAKRLGEIGDAAAMRPLLDALQKSTHDEFVEAAQNAIGTIHNRLYPPEVSPPTTVAEEPRRLNLPFTCSTCGGSGKILCASHWQKCPECQGPTEYRGMRS
jgi:hypothetical protein